MNQQRSRDAFQRDAAASARYARPVVESAGPGGNSPMDRHWQRIARKLFEEGHEERDVMEALRRQGARAYVAADACKATRRHYRNVHHMAHRKQGLVAVAGGAGLWLLAGIVPVVFGLFKVLTGSTVAIVLPEDLR